ncbi:MAG TPA: SMP-30/gluconolactonase/LRE family protein [Pseudonocardia sp.]
MNAPVELAALLPHGHDLDRPECVLATAAGDLYVSDSHGGVTRIHPDRTRTRYTGRSGELPGPIVPNGVALEPDGSFLIAHLGDEGGVFRLTRDGRLSPVLREVDGTPLPSTNFVTRDRSGRLWVTVSTRAVPRDADYRPGARSGFVVLDDGRGPRIVADRLGYTNECAPSPDGRWLYVNETFARRLSRFPLRGDGLGAPEVVAEFGPGEFPDGLGMDVDGGVWVVCVVGNKVLRVAPDGAVTTVVDAGEPGYVAEVERAYRTGRMGPAHLRDGGGLLGHCSSIAFGGPDRRTAYLGSLRNGHLTRFDSPVAGVEPVGWHR